MIPERDYLDRYTHRLDLGEPFVVVTIVAVEGSVPQDVGAKMIVTNDGLDFGTVGGGRLEAKALETASNMLGHQQPNRFEDWSLKSDVGMTCGGRVRLFFELVGGKSWSITIFGAGHVSQSLAKLLAMLPCRVTCIDPRADWLAKFPSTITCVQSLEPATLVRTLDPSTFVLCMTRGHTSDLPVLREIYQSGLNFPYVGVIGSRAKAAVLRKELVNAGIDLASLSFHCPVGLPLGSNHPAEIAVSIAAQMLQVRSVDASRST